MEVKFEYDFGISNILVHEIGSALRMFWGVPPGLEHNSHNKEKNISPYILNFITGLKETNQFYQELIPRAEKVVEEVTKICTEYQDIVEKYRSSFGSSVGQQVLRRKRKKNALKENKEKQKKKFQAGEDWNTEKEPEGRQETEKQKEGKQASQSLSCKDWNTEKEPEGRQETEKQKEK